MSTAEGRSAPLSEDAERLRQALEELEQDRATGKMSAADFETLRGRLIAAYVRSDRAASGTAVDATAAEPAAPAAPAEPAAPAASSAPDFGAAAEALILAARDERVSCAACGVRPEPAARYCSSCGRHLGACAACGTLPTQVGARYCSACGEPLGF